MRVIRLETKISEKTRKEMNYLLYIKGLKYDSHLIESLVLDAYNKLKEKDVTNNELD